MCMCMSDGMGISWILRRFMSSECAGWMAWSRRVRKGGLASASRHRRQRGPVISTHLILTARSTPSHGVVGSVSVGDLAPRYVCSLFAASCVGWVRLRRTGCAGWLAAATTKRLSSMLPPCHYHPIMTASLYRHPRPMHMRARYLS
jgi:hypothetical protein